jgi:hypothetical protein
MMRGLGFPLKTGAVLLAVLVVVRPVPAAEPSPEAAAFFENQVRPLLAQSCFKCHGPKKQEAGLRLDSRQTILKGGERGPVVVPGAPERSLLLTAVSYQGDLKMPPGKKLSEEQIATLTRWVKMGAPWPGGDAPAVTVRGGDITPEERQFWSLQPVRRPPTPSVRDTAWPRSDIDRFILARLEVRRLKPAPDADRRTLIRRVTFDLTGLPPTPAEVDAFLADNSPDAFARVVDRLLASPHYGERAGRHWLDVVRYADTAGETADYPVPEAYRCRNYVIDAFNRDKPYDEFVREQIAGDILAAQGPREQYAERVVATGFVALSRRFGFDPQNYHHLTIQDTIDTLGQSVLGLSLGCARCHHHKFDPVTMSDYYALYGIFASSRYAFPGSEEKHRPSDFVPLLPPAEAEPLRKAHEQELARLADELKKLAARKEPAADVARLRAETEKRRAALLEQEPYPMAYGVVEDRGQNARIQKRGEPRQPGDEVPRRFLEVLGGDPLPPGTTGSGRLQLAEWLTRPSNPLTARVLVNRVWAQHFGKGLVATPNDFGTRGQRPTHPELLDYLADRFVADGWSVKALHRRLLLSHTYQLSCVDDAEVTAADPANDLCGRFVRQRLDAESIRDALLLLAGNLDESPGGRHPFPPVASWGFTQHNPFTAVYETDRRSVYLMTQRLKRHPFLALFDGPDTNASTAVRVTTTVPTQALFLMNDPLVHRQSAGFARRLLAARPDDRGRLELAHELALARRPGAAEIEEGLAFLGGFRELLRSTSIPAAEHEQQAWAALARTLMVRNEFLFVE